MGADCGTNSSNQPRQIWTNPTYRVGNTSVMDKSGRKALSENIARAIRDSGLSRLAWSQSLKLDVKGVERVEKDLHGDKGVGLSYVDQLAARLKLDPWQLLVPGLDVTRPPKLAGSEASTPVTTALSLGDAALVIAGALQSLPEAERELLSHHIAHLAKHGPSARHAAAIDAMGPLTLRFSPNTSVGGGSPHEPLLDASSVSRAEQKQEHSATSYTQQEESTWDSTTREPKRFGKTTTSEEPVEIYPGRKKPQARRKEGT